MYIRGVFFQVFAGGMETLPLVAGSMRNGEVTCIRIAHFGVSQDATASVCFTLTHSSLFSCFTPGGCGQHIRPESPARFLLIYPGSSRSPAAHDCPDGASRVPRASLGEPTHPQRGGNCLSALQVCQSGSGPAGRPLLSRAGPSLSLSLASSTPC